MCSFKTHYTDFVSLPFLCIRSAGKVESLQRQRLQFKSRVSRFNTRLVAVYHELCACLQAVLD